MPELDFNSWLEAELQAVADRLGKPVEVMTADWVIERLLSERAAGGGARSAPAAVKQQPAPAAPAAAPRRPTAAMKKYYDRNRGGKFAPAKKQRRQRSDKGTKRERRPALPT